MRSLALLAGLLILAGCASTPNSPAAAQAVAPATQPATTVTAATATAGIIGNWEGKWVIESMGYEGRTVLTIERIDGELVQGRATMFDTPYGDLSEPFAQASFDGSKLKVRHQTNASYVLSLGERDGKPRLSGPLVYVSDAGTYNGTIRLSHP